jgi:hypothetical protein
MSKGSRPRPFSIDQKTFSSNWDKIFGHRDPVVEQDAQNEDEAFRYLQEKNKENENASKSD